MAALLLAPALAIAASPAAAAMPTQEVSIMSYNVHGLPWPFTHGRPTALHEIGARLAAMRTEGDQPHLVLLQEAFSRDAKAIAREAGYPYAATGPGRSERWRARPDASEVQFIRADNKLKGEGDGTFEDSGLLVLSDYPILDVKRAPYSRFACAGYDCLANKGMLLVRVAVPGSAEPLTVVDTHMNSRSASGVPPQRFNVAYALQAEELRDFVSANVPANAPAIVAGDFNIKRDAYRRAMITGGGGVLVAAQDAIRSGLAGAAALDDRAAVETIADRGADWLFARGGGGMSLSLERVSVPFGKEPNGKSLSDHYGYVAYYAISNSKPQELMSTSSLASRE
jgi:endonuclease/exonuclease/phosphatase family metal-dependent hydrolase